MLEGPKQTNAAKSINIDRAIGCLALEIKGPRRRLTYRGPDSPSLNQGVQLGAVD